MRRSAPRKVTVDIGGVDYVNAAALQSDGASSVWGACTWPTARGNPDMAVARFLANGGVDPGFRIQRAPSASTSPTACAGTRRWRQPTSAGRPIQGDGKIWWRVRPDKRESCLRRALFRLSGTGVIEKNIGLDLIHNQPVNAVALQSDGGPSSPGTGNADFGLAPLHGRRSAGCDVRVAGSADRDSSGR